jgi:hypothetical protein
MPIVDPANLPITTRDNTTRRKAAALPSEPSRSTLWRRAHGSPSRTDKAAKQQYLTPSEEKALLEYVLSASERGYPRPVKFLRSLALAVAHQRSLAFQAPAVDDGI